ncbi:MAG TPA: flagellar basal-body rod protein FlgF, partial [Rhodospirillaceae bacterium]|nr:flagellar basal-body rod protein FlgF [Rhodospirillaceae bacterium]
AFSAPLGIRPKRIFPALAPNTSYSLLKNNNFYLARSLQGESEALSFLFGKWIELAMQGAGLILTSYQDSLARAMDITANNVANVNTTGYKRENVAFETYLIRPAPTQTFQFAIENGTYRDAAQGSSIVTGNPLDVSVQGEGYIPVQTNEGIRYTRAGAFQMNNDGDLVTAAGDKVLGDGDQAITLPLDAREILIGPDGTITAQSGSSTSVTQVGKLAIVKFQNEQAMALVGGNLYSTTEAPEPATDSRVVQGSIEQSNVQAVAEMTRMIEVSRAYQQTTHLLELENERQSKAIQRLGRATA